MPKLLGFCPLYVAWSFLFLISNLASQFLHTLHYCRVGCLPHCLQGPQNLVLRVGWALETSQGWQVWPGAWGGEDGHETLVILRLPPCHPRQLVPTAPSTTTPSGITRKLSLEAG